MDKTDNSAAVREILTERGPLLGKELAELLPDLSHLALWQACFSDDDIQISHFASYYLRYDIQRADQVRLSPSVLRDFLSFTLMSLAGQRGQVIDRQVMLSNYHRSVSQSKIQIARTIMTDVMGNLTQAEKGTMCAFIAGDNAYFLGHEEPRRVEQTGQTVSGSDIDIIIVHDGLGEDSVAMIERTILQAKAFYLRAPQFNQEVDFIVKSVDKMFAQFAYSNIHEKIASKIAYESMFIAGSVQLYSTVVEGLDSSGVKHLIEEDFERARALRQTAMRTLLHADPDMLDANTESLFFFSRERLEFQ
ncbi:MAG: hypothetical protein MRY64_05960 [Hyphomonadaceae bacterium]|nr:hypothetical protein [Hyphomonadaceae bacterium]